MLSLFTKKAYNNEFQHTPDNYNQMLETSRCTYQVR